MPPPLPVLIYFRAKEIVEGGGGGIFREERKKRPRVSSGMSKLDRVMI